LELPLTHFRERYKVEMKYILDYSDVRELAELAYQMGYRSKCQTFPRICEAISNQLLHQLYLLGQRDRSYFNHVVKNILKLDVE
jgi:hypothetical protein